MEDDTEEVELKQLEEQLGNVTNEWRIYKALTPIEIIHVS
jgi:hypothetical protein